jgi:polo-like kinase 1
MQVATPTDQIIVSKEMKPKGTLEAMHEVLTSGGFDDMPPSSSSTTTTTTGTTTTASSNAMGMHQKEFNRMRSPPKHKASVWVVRYVDYTSKYGLGFLLNTGSAGVYFNDSTKIVMSPDGSVFQYIDRRRRDGSPTASEHTAQTHLMSLYPAELQKKVTLLRHFRNYLVDQHKSCAQYCDDGSASGDGMSNMPMVTNEGTSSGASSSVKFGVSSTTLRAAIAISMAANSAEDDDAMDVVGDQQHQLITGSDGELPFLKKWVRTRHAILFRLSNSTAQVVFFDRR